MSRARNTTTAPTGSIAPLGLRLLPELRAKIAEAAREHGRSLNAEVTARLQDSFDIVKLLPFGVQEAIAHAAEESGTPPMVALERLVLAGQSHGGQVLNIRVSPGTTAQEVRDALNAALEQVPDADIVLEREQKP